MNESKHAYEHVVECVRHQTSPKQPPGIPAGRLYTHLVDHGRLERDRLKGATRAAIENGDLVRWRDADGTSRLTCVDDAEALSRAVDRLTASIDEWTERDKESLGKLNTALQEVRDDE